MRGAKIDGYRLKDARKRMGLTALDLAGLANVARSTISKAERNGRIDVPILNLLCKYLNTSPKDLIATNGNAKRSMQMDKDEMVRIVIELPVTQATKPGGAVHKLIACLRKALTDFDDENPSVRSGSTLIELRLSKRDIMRLYELLDEGKLSQFHVSGVELIGNNKATELLRQTINITRLTRNLKNNPPSSLVAKGLRKMAVGRDKNLEIAKRAQQLYRSGACATLEEAFRMASDDPAVRKTSIMRPKKKK